MRSEMHFISSFGISIHNYVFGLLARILIVLGFIQNWRRFFADKRMGTSEEKGVKPSLS